MESKDFPCFACTLSFDEPSSLVSHIRILHSSLSVRTYTCKFKDCFRVYDQLNAFRKHLISHSSCAIIPSKKFKLCVEASTSSQNLHTHNFYANPQFPEESAGTCDQDMIAQDAPPQIDNNLLFFNAISNSVTKTLASLYSKDTLTRTQVQEVVDEMKELFCKSFLGILEDSVIDALTVCNSSEVSNIKVLFNILRGMFDDVDTEYKRLNHFKEMKAYVEPCKYATGTANVHKNVMGQIVLEPVSLTGSFIPPRKILKNFLEIPGVLDQILQYMNSLDKDADLMENIVQGSLWSEQIKPKFGDKLVLPLNLSFDDLETNKDLGSHTTVHKLGACHIIIACLPPAFQSVLENIFLALLFHSTDKAFGIEEVFRPLLEELQFLEQEGINVVIDNVERRIYFALCLITGDNLGLNTILGFVESFSANYYCFICKLHREVCQTTVYEQTDMLRTQDGYERDLLRKDPVSTGIKTQCIWNDLSSFSICSNIYADIMHDWMEGIGVYDMCFILEYMVNTKKWLSWDELNDLVQGFYYGEQEFGNKPPLILEDKVKKESIGFSASEMLCLIRYFSLMVAHKVRDEEDPVWKFYLTLRQLVDMLFAPTFSRSSVPILTEMVAEHHRNYMSLSKRTLRPKYHKAIHYGNIILKVGPLKPIWAMRTEAKYKELRQAAHVTSCRKLITHTLAVKSSLKMCARFATQKGLVHRFSFSSYCECIPVAQLDEYVNFKHKVPNLKEDGSWNIVKWVNVDGTLYKPGMVVVVSLGDYFPQFGVIHNISVTVNNEANFLVKELITLGFSSHLHAYHVQKDASWDCFNFVSQKNLITFYPAHTRLFIDGESYVMLRHAL